MVETGGAVGNEWIKSGPSARVHGGKEKRLGIHVLRTRARTLLTL